MGRVCYTHDIYCIVLLIYYEEIDNFLFTYTCVFKCLAFLKKKKN